jgi:hypothetical protein
MPRGRQTGIASSISPQMAPNVCHGSHWRQPHQILRDNPGIHNPIWSGDGQWVYFARGSVTTSQMDPWRISPNGGAPNGSRSTTAK